MIKKLIQRLLGQGDAAAHAAAAGAQAAVPPRPRIPLGRRVEVPVTEHGIDRHLVDDRAIKVVRTLQQAGYQAYIVGGAVGGRLVGRAPQAKDVAPDPPPPPV